VIFQNFRGFLQLASNVLRLRVPDNTLPWHRYSPSTWTIHSADREAAVAGGDQMGAARRTILRAAAAAGTVGATGLGQLTLAGPAAAASPPGDVVGKVTVGYQGWFACVRDDAPINGWWHWAQNWGQSPSPTKAIVAWPDVRDYPTTCRTAFGNLGDGQPAMLFSSYDQSTVDVHFRWMKEYGIDTAALQRFNPTGGEGPTRDARPAPLHPSA
jgi:hypothetical protein